MEQIEQRKEKAAELSSGRHANPDYAPKLTPYERKKQCSLCSVVVCTAHITTSFSVYSGVHCCGLCVYIHHNTMHFSCSLEDCDQLMVESDICQNVVAFRQKV